MNAQTKSRIEYIRNIVFGVEDSLVSTIGLVSGVAAAGAANKSVVLTGMVLIFVEAFSMAIGSLLSENSAEEYESKSEVPLTASVGYAVVMFVSYLVSGFLIIVPYMFLNRGPAVWVSIAISLIGLFALGAWSGKMTKLPWHSRALAMSFLGGLTIVLGVVVGQLVERFS